MKRPLLIFPRHSNQDKTSRPPSFGGGSKFPSKEIQTRRFESKISELDRVLQNETAYLQQSIVNIVPEMILVLEIAGTIENFFSAVANTPGMEFLADFQDEIQPDENFYKVNKNGERTDKPVTSRVFLTMTNQEALRELRRYWIEYKKDVEEQDFKRGTTKFRGIFDQLVDIRPYSISDRIKDTGIEEYLDELRREGTERLKFEIELAFRENSDDRERAYEEVVNLLSLNGGRTISASRTTLSEIGYDAFIAEAPIQCFDDLTENTNVNFLKSHQILFFKPVGQTVLKHSLEEELEANEVEGSDSQADVYGEPVVALLDGLPLENHTLLSGRLRIDDPDEFSRNYLSTYRFHGTSMASLILHGDLEKEEGGHLARPLYVRPIMKGFDTGFGEIRESLPDDQLPVDLVHRAVRRMFEGEGDEAPTAPHVKIINFSIGDYFRPFHKNISPWAKLLDWLSVKYDVLFLVSAGNYVENLNINIPHGDFEDTEIAAIQEEVLHSILQSNYNRKILTPAESINCLTVGSSHQDFSVTASPFRKDLINSAFLLSPVSRIGFGYNNSVKPEILMPGGKKLFRKHPIQSDRAKTHLKIETFPFLPDPPGNLAAVPGPAGDNNKVGYTCGTSNATALTSRLGAQIYETLLKLNEENEGGNLIDEGYFTVLIKSLLVHTANWGEAQEILYPLVRSLSSVSNTTVKKHIHPFLGFGCVDEDKVLYCTDQRATLLGFGKLSNDERNNAHIYSFPLPPSIASQRIKKKLAVTLAWLSPLNFKTAKYRKADLYFDNLKENGHLSLDRGSFDFKLSQKGTVQHDILEGGNADAFIDGDTLNIKINCREDASGLRKNDFIKYGLAVTLEVMENVEAKIYEEIRARVQQRIRPRA